MSRKVFVVPTAAQRKKAIGLNSVDKNLKRYFHPDPEDFDPIPKPQPGTKPPPYPECAY
jgi:hypothetical protein